MRARWIAAGLACVAAASCTLLSLSDEITQSECLSDVECELLNRRDEEDFDPCQIWQCAASRRCELLPPDSDRDGALPPLCVEAGDAADCADGDADVSPGHPELCDGKDNDCDVAVDEGMLTVSHSEALAFDAPLHELAYAWNPLNSEIGIAYRSGDEQRVGFAVARGGDTTTFGELRLAGMNDVLRGSSLGIGVRVGRFTLAVTEAESPRRTRLGYVNNVLEGFTFSHDVDDDVGLRCTEAESCDASRASADHPASTRPRLSSLETQVLIGRVRSADPAARSCEEPASNPAVLNVVIDNFAQLQERTEHAVVLDGSTDAVAPALLAIDASDIRSATEQFGWLAAYPDPEGDLIVRRIRPDTSDLFGNLRLRMPRGDQPVSHVQLALGSITDNRIEIGLAVQEGCGLDARVLFGVIQLTWDITGRTEMRMYRDLALLAREDSPAEQPVLAWNRVEASWGIAYLTPDGVFARALTSTGAPRGDTAYRVRETVPSVREIAIVPSLERTVGVFGVYSYVDATASNPRSALDAAYLRACLGP